MSTGKLVKDYRPLLEYLCFSTPGHRNEVLPSNKDFEAVKAMSLKGTRKVSELIHELARNRIAIINEELAVEAVRRAWGLRMDEESAIEEISEELAGWILEISEELGLIKLSPK